MNFDTFKTLTVIQQMRTKLFKVTLELLIIIVYLICSGSGRASVAIP